MINYDKERKQQISEDFNVGSAPLSTEVDNIINYDYLEQTQDVNQCSVPSNVDACSLIFSNSFDHSNERIKERSEDANT